MPRITFLYFVFLQLQRTYPLAQLNLELGNTPSILQGGAAGVGCSMALGNTPFSSSACREAVYLLGGVYPAFAKIQSCCRACLRRARRQYHGETGIAGFSLGK